MHLLYTSKMDIIVVHRDGKACNVLSKIIVAVSVGPDPKIVCEQKYIITKNYVFVVHTISYYRKKVNSVFLLIVYKVKLNFFKTR